MGFGIEQKVEELNGLCLDRAKRETAAIENIFSNANHGHEAILQMGVEQEVATAARAKPDGTYPDINYDELFAYAKPDVSTLVKVKTEGQAFVFFRHSDRGKWFENGKANPSHRFFIADLPPGQMYGKGEEGETIIATEKQSPRGLIRREIILAHDNVRPVDAIIAADKMQEVTMRYISEECKGIRGSFAPKFLEPEDARKLINVQSVVMWLHLNGQLEGDLDTLLREITTLEHLEARGIYAAGMPGNADQTNLSIKIIDSQGRVSYGMFDPATMDGNDLAYRMQLGFAMTTRFSTLAMNQTNDSYRRLSRHQSDPIEIAKDMAEARPATATHGETKFGGFYMRFGPYTREGNELIASMAGQRGAGYLEQREPDGSNFRQEGRGADQSGVRSLRVLQQLAGNRIGLQMFASRSAGDIKAELLNHSSVIRLPSTLAEAIDRHQRAQHFFVQLFGRDIANLTLEIARDNLSRPARDHGILEFLTGRGPS